MFVLSFQGIRVVLDSTLFPYTTRFRSRRPHAESDPDRDSGSARERADATPARGDAARGHAALLAPEHAIEVGERAQDRKSTRLNSSHVKISYAVFCLKKKKKRVIYK